jgi:hypothetical protein
MRGKIPVRHVLGIAAIASTLLSATRAAELPTSIRTFVSSLGSDGNTAASCPQAKPCRTLAAAYTVTTVGGEIIALDTAEYGPITVTGKLSIFGTDNALIAVATDTTGVTINAAAGDRVIIRNFIITGAGATNTKGIALNSGQLALQHATLKQLTIGLDVTNTRADLTNTDIIDNDTGIITTGTGSDGAISAFTGPTQVRVAWGNAIGNTKAYVMNNPGTGTSGNKVTILEFLTSDTDAAFSTNMTGNGTLISGTGASCSGSNCQSLGYYSSYTNPH